jgi:hypothetical protein
VLSLARRLYDEDRPLDELVEKIRWHFRAARYAVPGPQELRQMLTDYFHGPEA